MTIMKMTDRIIGNLFVRPASGEQLAREFGVSRQYINTLLQPLVRAGKVVKEGVTRGTVYRLATTPITRQGGWRRSYKLAGLEEDAVFEGIATSLGLKQKLRGNVWQIFLYAFTEMLNNAIDHSQSQRCLITVELNNYDLAFTIRDQGVGVFANIKDKFNLADENDAISLLLKGKTTTMAERHSGEGLFFTARCADLFTLRSHRSQLTFDNMKENTNLSVARHQKGTEVRFVLRRQSKRLLQEIFSRYAPKDFDFQFKRTECLLRLNSKELFSRSEARRLLLGLEKFAEATLDFQGVDTISQGFSDEVFRIFVPQHPNTHFFVKNLRPQLQAMIRHVLENQIPTNLTIQP